MPDVLSTPCGLLIERSSAVVAAESALQELVGSLRTRKGLLLRSGMSYPGRYRQHWIGFVDPPVELVVSAGILRCRALNERGLVLMRALRKILTAGAADPGQETVASECAVLLSPGAAEGSLAAVLRVIARAFASGEDAHLGLYGAFGFGIAFGVLAIPRNRRVGTDIDDMVLYLPDRLCAWDGANATATELRYDFTIDGASTAGLPRLGQAFDVTAGNGDDAAPAKGTYAAQAAEAVSACRDGTAIEITLSRIFRRRTGAAPDALFRRLTALNPSPYEFLAHFGKEAIIGASPEMFVRADAARVEGCPISGTARRGRDAVEDADRILDLLNSAKAAAELTMCTDADRNDKAAICRPGSIRILGRRQIELYSHLIHTVDHVEGELAPGFDAIDALFAHVWAVTLIGAPRLPAIRFIEAHEPAPRRWYGGAIGRIGFDGRVDTGIVIRAFRLAGGVAEIATGATILHSSDPEDEERETELKAEALFQTLAGGTTHPRAVLPERSAGSGTRVAVIDLGTPFPRLLAHLFEAAGAAVRIVPPELAGSEAAGTLLVLAPGFDDRSLAAGEEIAARLVTRDDAVLGIGHGLLCLAKVFGGEVVREERPMHGDRVTAAVTRSSWLLSRLPPVFPVGCYHRLRLSAPGIGLTPVLHAPSGAILALEHPQRPIAGLLFHPESLLSAHADPIVDNMLARKRAV